MSSYACKVWHVFEFPSLVAKELLGLGELVLLAAHDGHLDERGTEWRNKRRSAVVDSRSLTHLDTPIHQRLCLGDFGSVCYNLVTSLAEEIPQDSLFVIQKDVLRPRGMRLATYLLRQTINDVSEDDRSQDSSSANDSVPTPRYKGMSTSFSPVVLRAAFSLIVVPMLHRALRCAPLIAIFLGIAHPFSLPTREGPEDTPPRQRC